MLRVVTTDQMRYCDELTITKAKVPGLLLMEHAATGVVESIRQEHSPLNTKHVVVFCGKGNNGGDGLAIARLLAQLCRKISVILLQPPEEYKGDAATNYLILSTLSKKFCKHIEIIRGTSKNLQTLEKADVIVDAIFGTGFTGKVSGMYAKVIEWINEQNVPVVSVDIPSGINGTTGVASSPSVKATTTVTLGCLKTGLLCNDGRINSGNIYIVDIGIPHSISRLPELNYSLVEKQDVKNSLPKRTIFAHKYSVGKVLVIGGSKGLTGAAAMSSLAALRIGAGAVLLFTPESVYPILAKKLTEVMVHPVEETEKGTIHSNAFNTIKEKLSWADVVVLGPGLGLHAETIRFVNILLNNYKGKILIDADGLNAVASVDIKKLKLLSECIMTPHVGEFSRLTGLSTKEIEIQRINRAQEFAKNNKLTLVLKGVPTVTAFFDGSVVINSTGNPGMATVGSGDILAGIIAGLWAQGMPSFEAAWCGVYLHGAAGDEASESLGEKSLLATDILDFLPRTLRSIEKGTYGE